MNGRIIIAKAATEMNGRIIIAKPLSTSGGSSLLEDRSVLNPVGLPVHRGRHEDATDGRHATDRHGGPLHAHKTPAPALLHSYTGSVLNPVDHSGSNNGSSCSSNNSSNNDDSSNNNNSDSSNNNNSSSSNNSSSITTATHEPGPRASQG